MGKPSSKSAGRPRTTSHSAGKPATLREKASTNLLATPSTLAPKLSSRDLKEKVVIDIRKNGSVLDVSSRKPSQSSDLRRTASRPETSVRRRKPVEDWHVDHDADSTLCGQSLSTSSSRNVSPILVPVRKSSGSSTPPQVHKKLPLAPNNSLRLELEVRPHRPRPPPLVVRNVPTPSPKPVYADELAASPSVMSNSELPEYDSDARPSRRRPVPKNAHKERRHGVVEVAWSSSSESSDDDDSGLSDSTTGGASGVTSRSRYASILAAAGLLTPTF